MSSLCIKKQRSISDAKEIMGSKYSKKLEENFLVMD